MKKQTAFILKGFIDEMNKDGTGWCGEFVGSEAYQLYRLIEQPLDIPEDKIDKKEKKK